MKHHDIVIAEHASYDADGFIGVQWDFAGPKGGGPGAEMHSTYGSYSKPLARSADGNGCFMHRWYEGSTAHVMLSNDPRVIALLPDIKGGESINYGSAGNFTRYHEDGRVTSWTSTNPAAPLADDAHAIFTEMHPTEGFTRASPWGKEMLGSKGYHVIMQGGARFDMGAIGGLPAPFDVLGSYASLKAAAITLDGQVISLGAGANEPVPLGNTLATTVAAIVDVLLVAIGAAGPTGGAAVTAALLELQAVVPGWTGVPLTDGELLSAVVNSRSAVVK